MGKLSCLLTMSLQLHSQRHSTAHTHTPLHRAHRQRSRVETQEEILTLRASMETVSWFPCVRIAQRLSLLLAEPSPGLVVSHPRQHSQPMGSQNQCKGSRLPLVPAPHFGHGHRKMNSRASGKEPTQVGKEVEKAFGKRTRRTTWATRWEKGAGEAGGVGLPTQGPTKLFFPP